MPMDFLERQKQARWKTAVLIGLFALGVLLTVAALYVAWAGAFYLFPPGGKPFSWWNPELPFVVGVFVVTLMGGGALFKFWQLREGGPAVARLVGGRHLMPNSRDLAERQLLNVVEEMAVASGIPVPAVYVLDEEPAINAFAAGWTTRDAVVGVTRGALSMLARDELQGTVAHEFSHILNGDMRLNILLIAILQGITCIWEDGQLLTRPLNSLLESPPGSRTPLEGVLFLAAALPAVPGAAISAVGFIGLLFARLIKSAIARQRELLADAAAVQFTRNPDGLAGVLRKVAGFVHSSKLATPNAEQASHLFVADALGTAYFNLFSTHPPIEERLKAIDPTFRGVIPELDESAAPRAPQPAAADAGGQASEGRLAPMPGATRIALSAEDVARWMRSLTPEQVLYGTALVASWPEPIRAAARDPFEARALIFALLLGAEPEVRNRQLHLLELEPEPGLLDQVRKLAPAVDALGAPSKLPLAELALPALKLQSPAQRDRFLGHVCKLVQADRALSVFEYALQRLIRRRLGPDRPATAAGAGRSLRPVAQEASALLSALAHVGQDDPQRARAAFDAGARWLGLDEADLAFSPRSECALEDLDAALDRLAGTAPAARERVLRACAFAVAADGTVTLDEAEMLRAVAAALDCPLPPPVAESVMRRVASPGGGTPETG